MTALTENEPRTTSKSGKELWTYGKLKGDKPGPGGNWHFIWRYEAKGKRLRKWYKSERIAREDLKSLNTELLANGADATLDRITRLQAYRATAMLEPFGVSLVEAVEFYVAARKREENPVFISTLVEAVRNQYALKLANKEVRESTVAALSKSLNGLAEAFGNVNIKTLSGAEIKAYIANKADWAPKTKAGKFTDWSTAFKNGVQLGLIAVNPLEGIDNFRVTERSEIEILPTDKIQDLIANAPERTRAGLVLKIFTGMRTSEVAKIDWSAIDLTRKHILVDAKIAKTRKNRLFKLEGLLANVPTWLAPYAKTEGRVYGLTESTFNKDIAKAEETVGCQIGDNSARHSFCSRHYVAGKSDTATTQISGHSIKMLLSNYTHLVTEEDAAKFFGIVPKN